MIKWFFTWLTGDLAGALTRAYETKKNSESERDKVRAEVAIKDIDAQIEARRQATEIRLATVGFWEMRLITFLIAGCFTLHLVLVTLDTCFKFGWAIPKFPAPMDAWEGTILLSFFGVQVVSRGFDTLAFIFGRKG